MGMGVAEAMRYHTSKMELEDEIDERDFADARLNPKKRQVAYWFGKWRDEKMGPRVGCGVAEVYTMH